MYKINAFITSDILTFYKSQDFANLYELNDLLTTDNFICGSFGFTFLNGLVENEIVDATFIISIYNHISNALKGQLDSYFNNHIEGQFKDTSYENSKLFIALNMLFKNNLKKF